MQNLKESIKSWSKGEEVVAIVFTEALTGGLWQIEDIICTSFRDRCRCYRHTLRPFKISPPLHRPPFTIRLLEDKKTFSTTVSYTFTSLHIKKEDKTLKWQSTTTTTGTSFLPVSSLLVLSTVMAAFEL